jgi:hypothetical protein
METFLMYAFGWVVGAFVSNHLFKVKEMDWSKLINELIIFGFGYYFGTGGSLF